MGSILGIKFREYGQIYYFERSDFDVEIGDRVIVKTDQGQGLGTVTSIRDELPEDAETEELKPVYRLAESEDLEKDQENELLAREARQYCCDCIRSRKLEMKLVDVEVYFDRSKIVFYFTAPARIDFRELVKDLVKTYRTRIELRQIGVRHETQMIGAVGNCGMVCCCRQFLRTFAPVTIKMAKEQNLFLNPAKISGICGRLLCCLSYEQSNYEEFHRACPKLGKKYQTNDGPVKVLRANLFRNSIAVLTEANEEKEFTLEEWDVLKPSRPDQAKQDAARAAAKRVASQDADDSGADGDDDTAADATIVLEADSDSNGAVVSDDQDDQNVLQQTEFGPDDVSEPADENAKSEEARTVSGTVDAQQDAGDAAGESEADVAAGMPRAAAPAPESVAGDAVAVDVASYRSADMPADASSDNSPDKTPDRPAGKSQDKIPAKDSKLAPLRKPVKSTDPGARRTSRGKRKRKRRPAGGSEE